MREFVRGQFHRNLLIVTQSIIKNHCLVQSHTHSTLTYAAFCLRTLGTKFNKAEKNSKIQTYHSDKNEFQILSGWDQCFTIQTENAVYSRGQNVKDIQKLQSSHAFQHLQSKTEYLILIIGLLTLITIQSTLELSASRINVLTNVKKRFIHLLLPFWFL